MAGEKPASDARRARLAKALKANIARRKTQAKAQERAQEKAVQDAPETLPDEDGCPN